MLLNTQTFTLAALISTLASGLPLDILRPRHIVPRASSYAIINVDGGTSGSAPAMETTVVEATKTVEVPTPGPTVTQKVTATVLDPAPASAPTSSSSKSTRSASEPSPSPTSVTSTSVPTETPQISSSTSTNISTPIETPKPVFITVTVSEADGATEYYDDGMWHTHYRIKTFVAAAATPTLSTSA